MGTTASQPDPQTAPVVDPGPAPGSRTSRAEAENMIAAAPLEDIRLDDPIADEAWINDPHYTAFDLGTICRHPDCVKARQAPTPDTSARAMLDDLPATKQPTVGDVVRVHTDRGYGIKGAISRVNGIYPDDASYAVLIDVAGRSYHLDKDDVTVVTYWNDTRTWQPVLEQQEADADETPMTDVEREIAAVLNRYSAESVSGTPDFILAVYLIDVLKAYNEAVSKRAAWRGEPVDFTPGSHR